MKFKYDYALSLTYDDPATFILENIRPGSNILEFGPAYGRMTKYLKEEMNCRVWIVEKDETAAAQASSYAEGAIVGDIEDMTFLTSFADLRFDHILFVDVLEHLFDPWKVLSDITRKLLKSDGIVWLSIPNIAHNSVLISLWNDNFEYSDLGILDREHLRFFARQSLKKDLEKAALQVQVEGAVVSRVGYMELGESYGNVPQEVSVALKDREWGEVKQFILGCVGIDYSRPRGEAERRKEHRPYSCQLLVNSGGGRDDICILEEMIGGGENEVVFDLTDFEQLKELRFDPIDVPAIVELKWIELLRTHGRQLVSVADLENNCTLRDGGLFLFCHSDAQFAFSKTADFSDISGLAARFVVHEVGAAARLRHIELYYSWVESVSRVLLGEGQWGPADGLQVLSDTITFALEKNSTLESQLADRSTELTGCRDAIKSLKKIHREEMEVLKGRKDELERSEQFLTEEIQRMKETLTWRAGNLLRDIRDSIMMRKS